MTKQALLASLEARRGKVVSGAELARELGVSRSAIWKGVAALNADGVRVESVANKGYVLPDDADVSEPGIRKYLHASADIKLYKEATSSNDVARRLASEGAEEWTTVVVLDQAKGRGRMGREFFSPKGRGVYFSVVLRPSKSQVMYLTALAAVAVAEALSAVAGREFAIKWVNDVYIDGKKCCGILTEAVSDLESGGVEYAVVGIGINVRTPEGGFGELADIATAACDGVSDGCNRVIAAVLDRMYALYKRGDIGYIVDAYRRRSFLIGERVLVCRGLESRSAIVLDIDDQCRLSVRYLDDDSVEAIGSGEVRLKW